MATIEELRQRTEAFLKGGAPAASVFEATPRLRFETFLPDHLERALELADRFMALADSTGGDAGLEAVLEEADRVAATEDSAMVKYALMVFITHHREGSRLPIPSLEERAAEELLPSARPEFLERAEAEALEKADPESQLNWDREDPLVNQHHEHWHVVYPGGGLPDGAGNRTLKDRQGELFYYMHQQMLARYDTERLAVSLLRVRPLDDYEEQIPESYDPGIPGFSARPSGLRLADVSLNGFRYAVSEHALRRDRLREAVDVGRFEAEDGRTIPVTTDSLGATGEATIGSASGTSPTSFYGNHHNFGHVLLARIHDPEGNSDPGAMNTTATAVRDPVFFR